MAGNSALDGLTRSRRQRAGGKTHSEPLGSEHTAPCCPSFQPPGNCLLPGSAATEGGQIPVTAGTPASPTKNGIPHHSG